MPRPALSPQRIVSIDIVRGFVMVVMALDHVRDWVTNVRLPPEDLARSSVALFATRWITHFCAPTFFLLAGVGIGLLIERQQRGAMTRYLLTRGAWLLILELVITPVGWQFGFQFIPAFALVPFSTRFDQHPRERSDRCGRCYGLPLPGVYLVWALVVLLLYCPCVRMARVKTANPQSWHRYA